MKGKGPSPFIITILLLLQPFVYAAIQKASDTIVELGHFRPATTDEVLHQLHINNNNDNDLTTAQGVASTLTNDQPSATSTPTPASTVTATTRNEFHVQYTALRNDDMSAHWQAAESLARHNNIMNTDSNHYRSVSGAQPVAFDPLHPNRRPTSVTIVETTLGAPSWLPPARKYISLINSKDDLHYLMPLSVGTPSVSPYVILDTGSPNLVLFNQSWCNTAGVPTACYGSVTSSTGGPTTGRTNGFNLIIDGELIDASTALYSDRVSVNFDLLGTFVSDSTTLSPATFERVNSIQFDKSPGYPKLQSFPDNGGVLGASFPDSSLAQSLVFTKLMTDDDTLNGLPIFSIDVDGSSGGRLWVNGIDEQYRSSLQWAEPPGASNLDSYHHFTIYSLGICGVNVFSGFVDSFQGIVDTGASCLSLPQEFFDMVVSWVPINCTASFLYSSSPNTAAAVCYLPPGIQTTLPTIQFKLTPNGEWLYLPFEDLILQYGVSTTLGNRVCIHRGYSINSEYAVISFGNRVLTSLYTVLAMNTRQVALANKRYFNASTVQCVVRKQCTGMQTHLDSFNTCQDPLCSKYYFFEMDDTTKTCRLSGSFHVVAVLFITLFVGAELLLNEIQSWLVQRVYKNVSPL